MEYSSLTFPMVPVLVQVIDCVLPIGHDSPPLGAVTVRDPLMLKFAGDVETTVVSSRLVIRTFTVVETSSGIVHG